MWAAAARAARRGVRVFVVYLFRGLLWGALCLFNKFSHFWQKSHTSRARTQRYAPLIQISVSPAPPSPAGFPHSNLSPLSRCTVHLHGLPPVTTTPDTCAVRARHAANRQRAAPRTPHPSHPTSDQAPHTRLRERSHSDSQSAPGRRQRQRTRPSRAAATHSTHGSRDCARGRA